MRRQNGACVLCQQEIPAGYKREYSCHSQTPHTTHFRSLDEYRLCLTEKTLDGCTPLAHLASPQEQTMQDSGLMWKLYRECVLLNALCFLSAHRDQCSPVARQVVDQFFMKTDQYFTESLILHMPMFATLLHLKTSDTLTDDLTTTVNRSVKFLERRDERYVPAPTAVSEVQRINIYTKRRQEERFATWALMSKGVFPASAKVDALIEDAHEATSTNHTSTRARMMPFTDQAGEIHRGIQLAEKILFNEPIPIPVVRRISRAK